MGRPNAERKAEMQQPDTVSHRAMRFWQAKRNVIRAHRSSLGRMTCRSAVNTLRPFAMRGDDALLSWRAALTLEQTGYGPPVPVPAPPCDIEPEPVA